MDVFSTDNNVANVVSKRTLPTLSLTEPLRAAITGRRRHRRQGSAIFFPILPSVFFGGVFRAALLFLLPLQRDSSSWV